MTPGLESCHALVLNAGRGSAVVVDAGPDPVAVDRCLHELGISRVGLYKKLHKYGLVQPGRRPPRETLENGLSG